VSKEARMSHQALEDKPTKVLVAQMSLYACLVYTILQAISEYPHIVKQTEEWVGYHYIGVSIPIGLLGFFTYMVGRGKKWARTAVLVYFLGMVLLAIFLTVQSSGYGPLGTSSFMTRAFSQLIALVLLFHKDSSAWFRKTKIIEEQTDREGVPLDQGESEIAMPEEILLSTGSDDEPLFVLKYSASKVFLRQILYFLSIPFCGMMVLVTAHGTGLTFPQVIAPILFAGASIWSLFLFAELLLFDEIRLYKDRMVKVKSVLGRKEVKLANAGLHCFSTHISRVMKIWSQDTSRLVGTFSGISYNEYLADPEDIVRLNRLLARLSGRQVKEFERPYINMKTLIKRRDR
jgi:hypothetical protein